MGLLSSPFRNTFLEKNSILRPKIKGPKNPKNKSGRSGKGQGKGGDPYWMNVTALLHFDGVDASTTFTDEKGNTWTAVGNAQIDTAQSKFGGSALALDGSGDHITAPASSSLSIGTDLFTIECWVYITAHRGGTKYPTIVAGYSNTLSGNVWTFNFDADGDVEFNARNSGGTWINCGPTYATPLPTGGWHHLALCRIGTGATDIKLFIDGSLVASSTSNPDLGAYAPGIDVIHVGGLPEGTYTGSINGWVDDLRITKGAARYTTNFTPPTSALPDPF